MSGGIYYAGGGTRQQHALQMDAKESVENMFRYLQVECQDAVRPDTLRRFCQNSVQNIEWLEDICGVKFQTPLRFFAGKSSAPPSYTSLYYSGNERSWPYSEAAFPVPRGHRVGGDTFPTGGTGVFLFRSLNKMVSSLKNVTVMTHSAATRLITKQNSKGETEVVGVEVRQLRRDPLRLIPLVHSGLRFLGSTVGASHPLVTRTFVRMMKGYEWLFSRRQTLRVGSRGGVILAAGGFAFNKDMVAKHIPQMLKTPPLGSMSDDGSGILLGVSVGAATARLDRAALCKFLVPPTDFTKTVFIGLDGRRVTNETYYAVTLGNAVMKFEKERTGQLAPLRTCGYLVMDANVRSSVLSEVQLYGPKRGELQLFQKAFAYLNCFFNRKKAWTISRLAKKCGIPPEVMEKTIREYNQGIPNDPAFHKNHEMLVPIVRAPFYAIRYDAGSLFWVGPFFTLGGLSVDEETGEVLHEKGYHIRGLYACGRNAVGIPSIGYVSGLSLADCVFSGRRAGSHASKNAPH